MDNITLIALVSMVTAAATIVIGCITQAIGETKAIVSAMNSMAQQPDIASTITRTLFVGLAMIESMAIYCFVIAMILIFANPFWDYIIQSVTQN